MPGDKDIIHSDVIQEVPNECLMLISTFTDSTERNTHSRDSGQNIALNFRFDSELMREESRPRVGVEDWPPIYRDNCGI
jgi:hypothetical protein